MNKLTGMLGIAVRAGKLVSGQTACEQQLRAGAAKLLLLDEATSPASQKAFQDACAYRNVPLRFLSPDVLGQAIGRPGHKAAVLTDEKLAYCIENMVSETDTTQEARGCM